MLQRFHRIKGMLQKGGNASEKPCHLLKGGRGGFLLQESKGRPLTKISRLRRERHSAEEARDKKRTHSLLKEISLLS